MCVYAHAHARVNMSDYTYMYIYTHADLLSNSSKTIVVFKSRRIQTVSIFPYCHLQHFFVSPQILDRNLFPYKIYKCMSTLKDSNENDAEVNLSVAGPRHVAVASVVHHVPLSEERSTI